MNKILTVSIAAYNVEKFLEKTLDSLIIKDIDSLEVLIINDGSKDSTLHIARKYEKEYPNIFRVINKENGGYGSTINVGIDNANGKYFKQLDGDDWYEKDNLKEILNILQNSDEDIIYTPYIEFYERDGSSNIINNKIEEHNKNVSLSENIQYANPYLPMHSLMFKTEILKKNNIRILENCFYTDVEYAVYPFIYSKSLKVIKLPLYVYRIGREGQSVSVEGRLKHYKDHLRVDEEMLDLVKEIKNIDENVCSYLYDYFASIFSSCISNYLLLLKPSKDNFNLIKEYDNKILIICEDIYKRMNKKSKTVRYIRNSGFFRYKILYYLKVFKRKIK
jgi:glycosyltransferase involved in cell wall biosynthesis